MHLSGVHLFSSRAAAAFADAAGKVTVGPASQTSAVSPPAEQYKKDGDEHSGDTSITGMAHLTRTAPIAPPALLK